MQWQRALVFANVDKLMWEDRAVLGDQLKQICLVKFRCPYLWIMKMAFGGKKEKCGRGKINSNNVRVFFMESKKKTVKTAKHSTSNWSLISFDLKIEAMGRKCERTSTTFTTSKLVDWIFIQFSFSFETV